MSCSQYRTGDPETESIPTDCQPMKDPFPLLSFQDPFLRYSCASTPEVIQGLPRRYIVTWTVNSLVSNVENQASHIDEDLVCPRGIIIYQDQIWAACMMSDVIVNYDLFGNKMIGSIRTRNNRRVSSFPSGIAANCGGSFSYNPGNTNISTRYAALITPTKTGDIVAYNPMVNERVSDVVLSQRDSRAGLNLYTGIAIVGNLMYLANFFQQTIDVYNGDYILQNNPGRNFVDNYTADPIPVDYSPINIVFIEPFLYVMYAQRDPFRPAAEQVGPNKGFISVFSLEGRFERRLVSRGRLNAPWSIIPAPCECGIPPGSFMVSNIGSGEIVMYDKFGNDLGPILGQAGVPIKIEGLQSLAPYYGDFNRIYFTASSNPETNGLLGCLVVNQIIAI